MYTPSHYSEKRVELALQLIEEYPFATLLTRIDSETAISHLPFILHDRAPAEAPALLGHMARANPQSKQLMAAKELKLIFQGPHAYISPAWYTPDEGNVPTWNYAVVHVTGTAELIDEPEAVYLAMKRLVARFENVYDTGWEMPSEPNFALDALVKQIVVFRLVNLRFEAKFKLSQKLMAKDRTNVIGKLKETQSDINLALAALMAQTGG